jgi:hypothetical protein
VRLAALALAAVLLTGCGGNDPTSEGDVQSTGSPITGPSGTATGTRTIDPSVAAQAQQLSDLQSLAAAAQSAAADLNSNPPLDGPVIGADISWPQCPAGMGIPFKESSGQPMPRDDAEYVVIGLTNGPGFHVNPCLADQVTYARERGLLVAAYSVISWPDDATQAQYGGLQEAGRAQAQFNLQSMRAAGLDSPIIWLDVESVPHYDWSTDANANAQVVLGAAQGYADAGYRIGVYSTPAIWAGIVGDLSLGVPEWRAAGQTSQEEALSRCGNDWLIQGGLGALAQWVEDGRDRNITCPGTDRLGDYFTRLG